MRVLVFVLGILAAPGCFGYVPVGSPPDPGAHLRATLSDRGTADLAPSLGPSVAAVEGRLVSHSEDQVVLAVSSTMLHNGVERFWNQEQVAVPRDLLATLQTRRLSRSRTVLFTGGLLAGGLLLNAALGDALGIGVGGRNDGSGKQY